MELNPVSKLAHSTGLKETKKGIPSPDTAFTAEETIKKPNKLNKRPNKNTIPFTSLLKTEDKEKYDIIINGESCKNK
tara:strand:- start:708 stop:938 length:231 start_codon:yes stop_codon:yes gene_type:complete